MTLSYPEVHTLVEAICDKITADHKPYQYVYPIKYGGFVPAAMIAYRLNLFIVDNIRGEKTTLIVDDGLFTGETIQFVKDNVAPNHDFAVLVTMDENITYFGKVVDSHVRFPWEGLK